MKTNNVNSEFNKSRPLKNSILGILSLTSCLLSIFVIIIVKLFYTSMSEIPGYLVSFLLLFSISLSIVDLCKKNRKKTFSIIALSISGIIVILFILFIVLIITFFSTID